MPRTPRVVIPENPTDLFTLVAAIAAHSETLGSKSPLTIMESDVTIAELGPQAPKALALQADIDRLERELKEKYGERQPYIDRMTPFVRDARTLLLGVYSQNPRKLGDFGYDVKTTEAPKPKAPKPPTA